MFKFFKRLKDCDLRIERCRSSDDERGKFLGAAFQYGKKGRYVTVHCDVEQGNTVPGLLEASSYCAIGGAERFKRNPRPRQTCLPRDRKRVAFYYFTNC